MNREVLPWLLPRWQQLRELVDEGKAPHGLLIAGPPESGKTKFAGMIAAYLLCRGAENPCGSCDQCRLIEAGTHPDLLDVSLEDSKQIKIEQVRDLIHWAMQTSQQGGYKICVINPADKLNIQSANALLKVLEEPPPRTVICLVTDQPTRLLPTLRSRCQKIDCHTPPRQVAVDWLEHQLPDGADVELLLDIAGGVPLRVVHAIDEDYMALRRELAGQLASLEDGVRSPVQVAASTAKQDPAMVLEVLYQLVADSIGFSLSGGRSMRNRDLRAELEQFATETTVQDRYALLDRISEATGQLAGTSNANPQMLLEWVLVKAA